MRGSKIKFGVGIAAGFVAGIAFVVACGSRGGPGRHDAGRDVPGASDVRDVAMDPDARDIAMGRDVPREAARDAAEDRGFLDVLRDVFGVDAQDAHAQDAPCMVWQVYSNAYSNLLVVADPVVGAARSAPEGWEPFGGLDQNSVVLFRRCVR